MGYLGRFQFSNSYRSRVSAIDCPNHPDLCYSNSSALTPLLLLVSAKDAKASLLGTDWSNFNSNLYSIDTNTGTATLIGPTGQIRMIGLVVDVDSTIYAISEQPSLDT